MKVVYLHVGLPKTGSSAIQEFLRDNAETLKGLGYYVPNYGGKHISHYSLIGTLTGLPAPSPRHLDATAIYRDLEQWPDAVVLSSEKLFAVLHHRQKAPLLRSWRAMGAKIVVVLYVRNQAQFLNSAYSQNVKNFRFAGSFVEYLEPAKGRLPFNPYRFVKAAHRHGVELRMRPYSPDVRRNNVVTDFLETIGISDKIPFSSSRVNVSAGPFRIEAARRLLATIPVASRRLTPSQSQQARNLLSSAVDDLEIEESSYCGMTSEQARMLDSVYREDNEKLASEVWGTSWQDVFAEDLTQDFVPNDYQMTGVPPGKTDALNALVADLAPRIGAMVKKSNARQTERRRLAGC